MFGRTLLMRPYLSALSGALDCTHNKHRVRQAQVLAEEQTGSKITYRLSQALVHRLPSCHQSQPQVIPLLFGQSYNLRIEVGEGECTCCGVKTVESAFPDGRTKRLVSHCVCLLHHYCKTSAYLARSYPPLTLSPQNIVTI